MPKFAGHEKDLKTAKAFNVDMIAYDEKKFVKFKWYFPLFLPIIIFLSSIGILNFYRTMYYFRNYTDLNRYIKNQLQNRMYQRYDKVLWIKAAGIDTNIIEADGMRKEDRYLYLYDPVARYPRLIRSFIFFERVFTFDPSDSNVYEIEYAPMFTDMQCQTSKSSIFHPKIDLVYVGSFTLRRFISCTIMQMFSKGQKYRLILVNGFLFDATIFGVEFRKINISRTELFDIYSDARLIFELRDLDQSGPSQRMNDSLNLGLPYLSIPCVNLKEIIKYYKLNLTVNALLNRENEKTPSFSARLESEKQLNSDDFLIKVLNLEKQSDY